MCVEVHWIIISDAGSTPATSTRLRFELAKNEAEYGVVPNFGTKPICCSKLRRSTTLECFYTFIKIKSVINLISNDSSV